jgi:hypothetical protein
VLQGVTERGKASSRALAPAFTRRYLPAMEGPRQRRPQAWRSRAAGEPWQPGIVTRGTPVHVAGPDYDHDSDHDNGHGNGYGNGSESESGNGKGRGGPAGAGGLAPHARRSFVLLAARSGGLSRWLSGTQLTVRDLMAQARLQAAMI